MIFFISVILFDENWIFNLYSNDMILIGCLLLLLDAIYRKEQHLLKQSSCGLCHSLKVQRSLLEPFASYCECSKELTQRIYLMLLWKWNSTSINQQFICNQTRVLCRSLMVAIPLVNIQIERNAYIARQIAREKKNRLLYAEWLDCYRAEMPQKNRTKWKKICRQLKTRPNDGHETKKRW